MKPTKPQCSYSAQPDNLVVFTILCPFGAAASDTKFFKSDSTTASPFVCEESQDLILVAVASLHRDI